jgi:2-C-methyl-D-erythritol 4-phosphate cytidylyltransferase / 2-C-methyl-D-erythritol 2,4-cyclodiphosphate synthase
MSNFFIILAAGINRRLNSRIPKPYIKVNNKELIQYSIDAANSAININKIVIVYNSKHKKFLKNKNFNRYLKVPGGKNRAESVFNALKKIKKYKCTNVLIHDAARPNISAQLINNVLSTLKKNKTAIPVLKVKDTIKIKKKKKINNINRDHLYSTQTPQGFNYDYIYKLNSNFFDEKITDDSSLFINNNKKIKFIKGNENNNKITTINDIKILNNKKQKKIKYGIGFDIHRLVPKRKLYLGGIKIPFELGTLGHSDGDPVLHAITDSVLGACQMGDIGEKFSDKNKKFRNIRSTIILSKIINEINSKNYSINNIDINIITQKPKIKKYKYKMINKISKICGISSSQINIKGKTTEKLGIIGKEKAIACEVITSVVKND